MGVLSTFAIRYANEHFRNQKGKSEKASADQPLDVELPAIDKQHLLEDSKAKFKTAVEKSVSSFQHDLNLTADQVNNAVNHLAAEIVGNELERYRIELSQLRMDASAEMANTKTEMTEHKAKLKAEIKAKLDKEMEAEKKQLVQQINTKLADAMASFLLETLQHNVDIGNQSAYLVAMLEEHKADFVKEVGDEGQTSK